MKANKSLIRKSHFLGTKIRNIRKRNHLTMEDLSTRCVKVDPDSAPSVSYISMIERGKRVPSEEMLEVIAEVFQKPIEWFLDGEPQTEDITPTKGSRGGIKGMALEPSFLFSSEILQIAIPEMLSQTGTSGRQFAHLLIRAHQEHNQNHFPDIERAAEEIGGKKMPLTEADLYDIISALGVKVHWFRKVPEQDLAELGANGDAMISSYFKPPGTIHVNQKLRSNSMRLKYDLAVQIGHCVLHNKDGINSVMQAGGSRHDNHSSTVDPQDILFAWRDFECSFFAGALLCPKVPFRQLLDRQGYDVEIGRKVGVSPSVAMRRMTAVSPYPHWHYFDAYAPGKLKAVYRGNGIPLPWGNMRVVEDPCQHWAVFRMINTPSKGASAQLSILMVGGLPRIYCCNSINVKDLTETNHVLCAGIDLNPALDAQGFDSGQLAEQLKQACAAHGGSVIIPKSIKTKLLTVAKILNIGWIEQSLINEVRLICSRGNTCPRTPSCYQKNN
jgi:transcriptional regulator with XRE-family HTH domain/Zn-dependent peptidase ImmA (M78 family)